MRQNRSLSRQGAIVPLVALSLVAVLGMVALAIDIGMVAVAKTQAQNAADSAAMAGTRSLNQQSGYNLPTSSINAVTAATQNKIFQTAITGDPANISNPTSDTYTSGQVKLEYGGYYYVYNDSNPSTEAFQIVVPGKSSSEPYTAIRATVSSTSPVFFGAVFGTSPFNVTAHAVAAHRPRDVVIIMDLSGSMRFQSCPGAYLSGTTITPQAGPRNKSLNPDPNYPTFGHYSDTTTAALYGNTSYSTGQEMVDPANLSVTSNSGPPCLADFMSSGSTPAFTAQSTSKATTPGGDNYIKVGSNYAKTVTDIVGTNPSITNQVDWCRNGYSSNTYNGGATFNGYTEGPNYWGKTFFIWPPDPRGSDLDPTNSANHADNGAKDWRQRFFFKKNTSTNTLYWLDNNTILFDPSGTPCTTNNGTSNFIMKKPDTTTTVVENGVNVTYRYCINYAAIFQWLRNTSPTHFPSSMTTGRINFYSKIPDPTGDSNFNSRFWTQNPMTDLSERFWKDYVDFMLGFTQAGANTYNRDDGTNPYSAYIGNGDYYAWGTVQLKQKPDCNYTATVNNSGGYSAGYNGTLTFSSVKNLAGTAVDLPGPQPVTGATNATPIVITSAGHGLANGNIINIAGVGGNTAANGTFKVASVTTNTFALQTTGGTNVAGNGTYTANTGSWVPAITAATNASPIVITTGAPHGLPTSLPTNASGSTATPTITVNISGVTGNTAANGKWTVTVNSTTQFTLNNSTGNGTFTSNANQWWEPVFYIRFGTQSTFYELNPALTTSGILTATPDIALAADVANSVTTKIYTSVPKYMDYADNPYRPRHQMWFGPQSWADWLGNYSVNNLRWPGNVHEAQAWACKIGISAAIDDIKNNHPNDFVGMCFFSSPNFSTGGGGQFNLPVVPLGRNYQNLKDSLWFPPSTVAGAASTITPYDSDFANVPRAHGGTAPGMGFMLAYNLLSSSTTNLRNFATPSTTYRGYDGGLGRKGAARIVIFETDGAPNTRAYKAITSSGSDSYYAVRIKDPSSISNGSNEFPTSGSYSQSEVTDIVKQIVALDTASPPGYSTSRKTALVYSLGYGTMFDPNNKSNTTAQNNALAFLQTVQYYGNVNTAGGTSAANFPDWQRIYGDTTTRQTRLQSAFTTIMQAGIQVSLIE
ncbi:MAG TPA: pilus assembly protein TadG-related protein [Gemmataceae bacterium]|nr:pilus assembly protein TadG-related protein [Gemmataceae bacterium]